MLQKNIVLKLNDTRSNNTLLFQLSPLQIHVVTKILGLDFDTLTGKVEYFDDNAMENIIANDTFLQTIEKRRNFQDIHVYDEDTKKKPKKSKIFNNEKKKKKDL